MNSLFLQVALPVPLAGYFDYLPPPACDLSKLKPGLRVKVPFGRRELVGILLGTSAQTKCEPKQLKAALEILDELPILSPLILELSTRASQYYHYALGEVVVGMLPKWLRLGRQITPVAFENATPKIAPPALTAEQEVCVNAINTSKKFQSFLLMGVTGSGKTEVYLRAIEPLLAQNKSALILVPEIGLTPQTLLRFSQRFSVPVIALHSNLSDKQRFKAWCAAAQIGPKIIVGTRSAIFAPIQELGIIVVDEEHDASFKQQNGFRYSARDLAVMRAQMENIPIILGSATPSLETLHNTQQGKYQLLKLTECINQRPLPKIKLIDLKNKKLKAGLSEELIIRMRHHLEQKHQVLVFLNRRGFAPTLMCHACSFILSCKRCDAHLTLHQKRRCLVCHHCGHEASPPRICPDCHQAELIPIGQGTERIESVLQEIFPEYSLLRVDRDTTRKKDSLEEKLAQIENGEAQILIGTQMLAKGHHFANLTLAVLVDVDGGLFSADFRATEKMAQLIIQVAGRAGREDALGEVILQTHLPEHPMLNKLLQQGYLEFANATLDERRDALLPPFSHLALVKAEATKSHFPQEFLVAVKRLFMTAANSAKALSATPAKAGAHPAHEKMDSCLRRDDKLACVNCLGPIPALMAKKAGKYRSHLLLQAVSRQNLQKLLSEYLEKLNELPEAKRVRWVLDVDPLEL